MKSSKIHIHIFLKSKKRYEIEAKKEIKEDEEGGGREENSEKEEEDNRKKSR